MGRRVLTPAAAMEIKRLHGIVDQWDRPVYTQIEIAKKLGVSETTVFRVLHKVGPYETLREVPTDTEAAESYAKLVRMLEESKTASASGRPAKEVKEKPRERWKGPPEIPEHTLAKSACRNPLDEVEGLEP